MSINLAAAQAEKFDSSVLHAVQAQGRLEGTGAVRDAGNSGIYQFRSMGSGIANQKATSEDVTPMNISHAKIPCTLENWNAPEYTDIFDDAEVNFSEVQELSQTIGLALARRRDQLRIDALEAATPTLTVAAAIGGTASDWNVAKIRRCIRLLLANGASGTWHAAISAQGWESLLGQTEFTSSDYNDKKPLTGDMAANPQGVKWAAITWHVIDDRTEGGLPKSGNDRTSWVWVDVSQGFAEGNVRRNATVDWVPQKTSWLSNGLLKAGAVDRDPARWVEVTTTEA